MKAIILLSIFNILIQNVHLAKILGVFPMTAKSHYILGSSLMRALAEKGHDVTVISPFTEKVPPKNGSYRDIVLTGLVEQHDQKLKEMGVFSKRKIHPIFIAPFIAKMSLNLTETVLQHPNVQTLIHSDETFDLVIVEEFINQAHKAFAPHFKSHLVLMSTMGANSWVNSLVGNPTPLAYLPDPMLGYPSNMCFWERLLNTVIYVERELINHFYIYPKHGELVKKYFPDLADFNDILYNASLVLINSHSSTNPSVPYVPRMIDIGGFHIKPPKKLPKDLQNYLDNSKNGVIYFSLGSNAKSSLLPIEKRQIFIDTFAKLDVDVLWKWEEDELPGKPDNVRIGKWLPQQDILAHPNVKLFITHAGLLSTIETIYHGMPVLAVPIGGDQTLNAKQIENQGFGLMTPFHDITEDIFTEKIKELLTNTKYRQSAKNKSIFYHDRLVDPMKTAIYWIEYVIRHNGTAHLKIAGLDLPWYQYLLLDVIATMVIAAFIVLFIILKIMQKMYLKCFKSKKDKLKKQ